MRSALIALAVVGAACTTGPAAVPWDSYRVGLVSDIARMVVDGDCAGLQEQFNAAAAASDATRARTGHSNAALMEYIEQSMDTADC